MLLYKRLKSSATRAPFRLGPPLTPPGIRGSLTARWHHVFQSYIKSFTEALRIEYQEENILVQHLFPLFVNTKMNAFSYKLQETSLFVPDAKTYTTNAVNTLGLVNHSTGYWAHGIQVRHFNRYIVLCSAAGEGGGGGTCPEDGGGVICRWRGDGTVNCAYAPAVRNCASKVVFFHYLQNDFFFFFHYTFGNVYEFVQSYALHVNLMAEFMKREHRRIPNRSVNSCWNKCVWNSHRN